MLPARHNQLLSALLIFYLRRLFRRHFRGIYVAGVEGAQAFLDETEHYPLIFFSNHQTWWDGFFELPLIRQFRLFPFLMMEEKNLRRLQFFRNTGVFGVDLESPRERARGLLYATRVLRGMPEGQRRALFLYPHGRIVSPHEDWPPFLGGLEVLLRKSPAVAAVPVYKRILYGNTPLPEVSLYVGEPLRRDAQPGTQDFEQALRATGEAQARFLGHADWNQRSQRWL